MSDETPKATITSSELTAPNTPSTATPDAVATSTTVISTPGRPDVKVDSSVGVSSKLGQALEQQVVVVKALAAIPFFAALKALFILAMLLAGLMIYSAREEIIAGIVASVERHANGGHDTALRDAVAQHKVVGTVLDNTRESLKASRVLLFQFHNGQSSLKGLPFLYMSETAESISPGISDEHTRMQRLPLFLGIDWIPSFLRGDCVEQSSKNANSALQTAMAAVGSVSAVLCPVFLPGTSEPTGYVSASYTTGWSPAEYVLAQQKLRDAAKLIGTTLSGYTKK